MYWRSRAADMKRVLDRLDEIEAAVPRLFGRLDRSRVAVAGHSMGGHTASLLLGARLTDPHDGTEVDLSEPRLTSSLSSTREIPTGPRGPVALRASRPQLVPASPTWHPRGLGRLTRFTPKG